MKPYRTLLVLVIALLPVGCVPADHHDAVEFAANITMTGSADDGYTKNVPTRRSLDLLDAIETRGVMAFKVIKVDADQAYQVIVGTSEGDTQSAEGYFIPKAHPEDQNRLMHWFHLSGNCWVYVYGDGPAVQTDLVEAGADGSTLLVQFDKDGNGATLHRVYFMGGKLPTSTATVWSRLVSGQKKTLTKDQYVEADKSGNLSAPKQTPAPDPNGTAIQAFLAYVNDQIQPFKK